MNKIKPEAINVKPNQKKDEATEEEQKTLPWTSEACLEQMLQTNRFIKDVSAQFAPPSSLHVKRVPLGVLQPPCVAQNFNNSNFTL